MWDSLTIVFKRVLKKETASTTTANAQQYNRGIMDKMNISACVKVPTSWADVADILAGFCLEVPGFTCSTVHTSCFPA